MIEKIPSTFELKFKKNPALNLFKKRTLIKIRKWLW